MTIRKYLFITSTVAAQESVTSFTKRLLAEGQRVAVMGPAGLTLEPEVETFSRITQSREFEPDVVLPMDEKSILGVQGVFAGSKARFLNKDPLTYQLANCRSFGLSLLAKAGMPVIPYHVINNAGDALRFEAKRAENPEQVWEMYPDHPDLPLPDQYGTLGLPQLEGEVVQVAYLVSGRNLVRPAFVHYPMQGLLAKGGMPDYRGRIVIPSWNSKLAFIGSKIQAAVSAIGASGFVFVDLLFPPKKRGKAAISRLSLTPPRGFLPALFFSEMLNYRLADALYQVSGLKEFYLPCPLMQPAFCFVVGDQIYRDGWPADPGFHATVGESMYEQGIYVGSSPEIPDELWDARPTAEVKLDGQVTLDYALRRMAWFKLLPDSLCAPETAELPDVDEVEEIVDVPDLELANEDLVSEDNPAGLDIGELIEL